MDIAVRPGKIANCTWRVLVFRVVMTLFLKCTHFAFQWTTMAKMKAESSTSAQPGRQTGIVMDQTVIGSDIAEIEILATSHPGNQTIEVSRFNMGSVC